MASQPLCELSRQVAELAYSLYRTLPKTGKPQEREYTVLAAFAICSSAGKGPASAQIVALGTGTKCLGGAARSASGHLLHDSHAEVLARRALMKWLYAELELATQEREAQSDAKSSAVTYDSADKAFRLRDGLQLHMFVSQPPCGDASIVTQQGNSPEPHRPDARPSPTSAPAAPPAQGNQQASASATTCATNLTSTQPALAPNIKTSPAQTVSTATQTAQPDSVRFRTGAKALRLTCAPEDAPEAALKVYVPQQSDVETETQTVGILRRKPGKGDATLSLSCSDKLARWSCLGVQGALLSGLLASPLYTASITVACTHEVTQAGEEAIKALRHAVTRGVGGRLVGNAVTAALKPPFSLNVPDVYVVPPPPSDLRLCPGTAQSKGSGSCINWVAEAGSCGHLFAPQGSEQPVTGAHKGSVEVTTAAQGYKAGASKVQVASGKAQPRMCRAALAADALDVLRAARAAGLELGVILGQQGASADDGCLASSREALQACTYSELKKRVGCAHRDAWARLRETDAFRLWIDKPEHLQDFQVHV